MLRSLMSETVETDAAMAPPSTEDWCIWATSDFSFGTAEISILNRKQSCRMEGISQYERDTCKPY